MLNIKCLFYRFWL